MRLSRLLKIVGGLIVVLGLAIGLTSIDHPIILKWVTGSARHLGKAASATVYTNGQVNERIKVFYSDEGNGYVLAWTEYDSLGMSNFININLDEKWIGTPVGTSKTDFDIIAGHLFQSKTDGSFSPFQDDMKASNFDPQLSSTDGQIKFNMPRNKFKFDSVRIRFD